MGGATVNSLLRKHHFSGAACGINYLPSFRVSVRPEVWPRTSPPAPTSTRVARRPFPLPSNLRLSPAVCSFQLLIQHLVIGSDRLWQMANHESCRLSCQS